MDSDYYRVSDDTFFFADNLKKEYGESALDIGTGSGYLAWVLLHNFSFVVASDINFNTLKSCDPKPSNRICCDGASAFLYKFDLVICNPPYLPSEKIIDLTTDGGKQGLEIPLKIIKSTRNCIKQTGKLLFLTSSLSNYKILLSTVKSFGFEIDIISKKNFFLKN